MKLAWALAAVVFSGLISPAKANSSIYDPCGDTETEWLRQTRELLIRNAAIDRLDVLLAQPPARAPTGCGVLHDRSMLRARARKGLR